MKVTEEQFKSLIHTLETAPSILSRSIAASELGDCEDSRAIKPLRKCLDENDSEILASAIKALGKLRDDGSIPRCLSFLDESYDKWVRIAAISALCYLPYIPAQAVFRNMLNDSDNDIRHEAILGLLALSRHKGPEIKIDLANFLSDSHEPNRHLAQQWLEIIEKEEREGKS
jgi:HEAT repeat protein